MSRRTSPDILPPMEGVSYLLDETYLENLKHGRPPHGEPVVLDIFIERIIERKSAKGVSRVRKRIVHEIRAATEALALDQLREFASRPDVELVDEKTRQPVTKEWLKEGKP